MRDQIHEKVEFGTMRDLVEYFGEKYGDKPSFTYRVNPRDPEPVKKSYTELSASIRAISTELHARGYRGKHIAVIGKHSYPWVLNYFAVLATGAVLVPLDRDWTAEDLASTAKRAEIDLVMIDADIKDKAELILSECGVTAEPIILEVGEGASESSVQTLIDAGKAKMDAGDRTYYEHKIDPDVLSLLVFTSGTTGKGKGVMLTQTAVLSDLSDVIPFIDFAPKTVNVLPPHHTYGSSVTMLGHASLGLEIYISSGIRYILKELEAEKPGHLILVPLYLETFYRKIQANIKQQGKEKLVKRMIKISNVLRVFGIDLRRKFFGQILKAFGGELNLIICGGAPINQEILEFFEGIGVRILNGYGITECAPIVAVNHSRRVAKGSVGFPLSINEVKIDEPNENGEGEILVRGKNVMLGYFKDEEATREAMTEDGFFRTGDYGKIGKNGALYITGRKKNLIILSNGKNVYPEEIESEFIAIPGLLDIIVYEGKSKRGSDYDAIVAEIFPDYEYLEKNGITDPKAYFQGFIDKFNTTCVPYKKIGVLKVRTEDFPKNTLRKIMRFKLDMSID
ncbi:MAG: AMP-binding protein [Clostridia bacterium]|nr:AMP-binding protein [Clostridia bacterium]